ncbi:MAG: LytR/AlgR family response regulator transcription factor, partial [Wenzhouxiangellaceae bacterium]
MKGTVPVRLMIVDDEAPAVERLAELVRRMPGFELVGCESRSARVAERCRQLEPDVLLMDIEMPGHNGLELARELRRQGSAAAIVFVTAHDDFALDAFGVAAIDYVVKPVRPERLAESLRRVVDARGDKPMVGGRLGERLVRVALEDVRAFTAEDKCTVMHVNGGRIMVDEPLKT